jgi:hypothetical protein
MISEKAYFQFNNTKAGRNIVMFTNQLLASGKDFGDNELHGSLVEFLHKNQDHLDDIDMATLVGMAATLLARTLRANGVDDIHAMAGVHPKQGGLQ